MAIIWISIRADQDSQGGEVGIIGIIMAAKNTILRETKWRFPTRQSCRIVPGPFRPLPHLLRSKLRSLRVYCRQALS